METFGFFQINLLLGKNQAQQTYSSHLNFDELSVVRQRNDVHLSSVQIHANENASALTRS